MSLKNLPFPFKLLFFESQYQEARSHGQLPTEPLAGTEDSLRLATVLNAGKPASMFADVLSRIAELDDVGISHMITGNLAIMYHGGWRRPEDYILDVLLMAGFEAIGEAEWLGFELLTDDTEFMWETVVMPCQDRETGIRVNFILADLSSPYVQQAFARSETVEIEDGPISFASLEDLIIHLTITGASEDLEAIGTLLDANQDPDLSYIRHWLEQFSETQGEPYLDRFSEVVDRE